MTLVCRILVLRFRRSAAALKQCFEADLNTSPSDTESLHRREASRSLVYAPWILIRNQWHELVFSGEKKKKGQNLSLLVPWKLGYSCKGVGIVPRRITLYQRFSHRCKSKLRFFKTVSLLRPPRDPRHTKSKMSESIIRSWTNAVIMRSLLDTGNFSKFQSSALEMKLSMGIMQGLPICRLVLLFLSIPQPLGLTVMLTCDPQ
jgi:hypothetical protein